MDSFVYGSIDVTRCVRTNPALKVFAELFSKSDRVPPSAEGEIPLYFTKRRKGDLAHA